jgi:hypothetical protein
MGSHQQENRVRTIGFSCFAFLLLVVQGAFGQQLSVKQTVEGVDVSDGGTKVLFYQKATKSLDGQYQRAGYVHPLYSLDGEILTEDFPKGHPHHHGVFLAWHQIIHKGENIANSWTSENMSWDVKQLKTRNKGENVVLVADVFWNTTYDQQPLSLIRENTTITVHSTSGKYRVIDFETTLKPLVTDLKIGGANDSKGYGGFSLRFKAPASLKFISQGQAVAPQENSVIAGPWMDFVGSFGNSSKAGVAVFNHPSNPGNINEWILRNSSSMQNPVYPGRVPVDLPKKGTTLRYRLIIHSGNMDQGMLEKLYREYARIKST